MLQLIDGKVHINGANGVYALEDNCLLCGKIFRLNLDGGGFYCKECNDKLDEQEKKKRKKQV
jgi:DNA-directed RNA polymerase subunit RPC12/RpoP